MPAETYRQLTNQRPRHLTSSHLCAPARAARRDGFAGRVTLLVTVLRSTSGDCSFTPSAARGTQLGLEIPGAHDPAEELARQPCCQPWRSSWAAPTVSTTSM